MKRIKLSTISKAIRKNGLPQTTRDFFTYGEDADRNEIVAACAIGQAAVNLKSKFVAMESQFFIASTLLQNMDNIRVMNKETYFTGSHKTTLRPNAAAYLGGLITHLNDVDHFTFEEIADWLDALIADQKDYYVPLNNL